DLVDVLQHTVRDTRRSVSCEIEFDAPSHPVYIEGDQAALPEIFTELLLNADREMKAAHTVQPRVTITITLEESEGTVVVDVVDNGPGIHDDIRDSLFEPYVTKSGGTGLGLAIIKDLVE